MFSLIMYVIVIILYILDVVAILQPPWVAGISVCVSTLSTWPEMESLLFREYYGM